MKLRYFTVFVLCFIAFFVFLNSRLLVAEVGYSLSTPKPNDGLPPSPRPSASPDKKLKTTDSAIISIEKLGVSAPIVFGVSENTAEIYKNLDNGVVHYSSSPKPGEKGVSMILGHSSDYPWKKNPYGSAFALLGKLNPGDTIQVKYSNGTVLNFAVRSAVIFNPLAEDARLTKMENDNGTSIVLISCWPVGTALKRIAVQAELL